MPSVAVSANDTVYQIVIVIVIIIIVIVIVIVIIIVILKTDRQSPL